MASEEDLKDFRKPLTSISKQVSETSYRIQLNRRVRERTCLKECVMSWLEWHGLLSNGPIMCTLSRSLRSKSNRVLPQAILSTHIRVSDNSHLYRVHQFLLRWTNLCGQTQTSLDTIVLIVSEIAADSTAPAASVRQY